ncbi:MAG: hypothetical protein IKS34_02950 [Clostridia bacterium]|nr:hypothetical protein [Clostridia bacterium]
MTENRNVFTTSDPLISAIYKSAVETEKHNVVDFNGRRAVVEGGEYRNLWLETQPMGGEMYAKRDLEAGFNNIDLFMDAMDAEGMMPGMLTFIDGVYGERHDFIQGYCFPYPALNMYYLTGKDEKYLRKVYNALKKNDAWFWANRESDGDGCLEAWCPCDTGEDYSAKFFGAPHFWTKKTPPDASWAKYHLPRESMDLMAYSYDARATLAEISVLLGNGEASYWREKAEDVRNKVRSYLWREEKHACYDRDENNEFLDILVHNNLRCMYHGLFDQHMADDFIRYHLFNPEEFWTPMPLPSIAVSDPCFRNIPTNDWSGQPEGLTFQRSVRALENYGHYAELTRVAEKLFAGVGPEALFTQQFDPFTAKPSMENNPGDYGPTLLACLEYMSRLYGVNRSRDTVSWGAFAKDGRTYDYTQSYGNRTYRIVSDSKTACGTVDGKPVFTVTCGCRVETDTEGRLLRVIGMDRTAKDVTVTAGRVRRTARIAPNAVLDMTNAGSVPDERVPYLGD